MNGCGEIIIEFLRNVARELQMLFPILAHRHVRRAVDQNVCGHQVRIDIQSDRGVLTILARLFLELGHTIEPADAGDTIENPGELGMFGDLALVENDVLLWIDAAGEERSGDFTRGARQFGRILPYGDGVQVDNAVDAVIALLQRHELGDGAKIVSEMQISGRLNAGENAFLGRHRPSSSI